jgi:hypothetical protein
VQESPERLTLPQAVNRALIKNFESRAQFERTLQARLTAKVAFLNLVPHLNLPNLLTNFPLSPFSSLAVIGDAVPFLLPNRWFMAKEAEQSFEAEKFGETLMQASLATQVEGLGYVLQRDLENLEFLEEMVLRGRDAEAKIRALEVAGHFPVGSADHLKAFSIVIELEAHALNEVIYMDKRAIAQALGYHNPGAIEEMVFDLDSRPLEAAVSLDEVQLGTIALQRSLELQQMNALIKSAQYKKKEVSFTWLDPSGDPTQGLGLGLSGTIAIEKSHINELKIKREQLQSVVLQKMSNAVKQYNHAVETYSLIQLGLETNNSRVKEILGEITVGSNLNTMDVNHILEEYVVAEMHQRDAVCEYRIARSNIDRMLLRGYYNSLFVNYFKKPEAKVK